MLEKTYGFYFMIILESMAGQQSKGKLLDDGSRRFDAAFVNF